MMVRDLADLPLERVLDAILGWRRGTHKLDDPDDMLRFPKTPELRRLATKSQRRYVSIEDYRR